MRLAQHTQLLHDASQREEEVKDELVINVSNAIFSIFSIFYSVLYVA